MDSRWIKLKEAASYSAIGKNRLKELAITGKITGFTDDTKRKDWIFDRRSLDAFRENQGGQISLKVNEVLDRL